MKRTIKINLLVKIIIAIALGVTLSNFMPEWCARIFVTFNSLFANFLSFFIPIIILTLVAPAIAELGKGAGRMLIITVALAYGSTILAGSFSYLICRWSYPLVLNPEAGMKTIELLEQEVRLAPYFTIQMPPFIDVMSAIVLAFIIGIGMAGLKTNALKNVMDEAKAITEKAITDLMIPLLPLYIFGIFLAMGVEGTITSVLQTFISIIAIIFAIHIVWLLLLFCISGTISKQNPLKMLANMLPAYMTALGTQSSAATIPVTLERAKRLGVSQEVSGFVIPLCATIHLSGSTLKIVACAYAIMIMNHIQVDFPLMLGFIMMLGVTMVAAPGVPGGAIMAALGVLSSILGFGDNLQAIMIALYIAMDSFGTACNVTGDGAIAAIVQRLNKKRLWIQ